MSAKSDLITTTTDYYSGSTFDVVRPESRLTLPKGKTLTVGDVTTVEGIQALKKRSKLGKKPLMIDWASIVKMRV